MTKPELSDPVTLRVPVDVLSRFGSIAEGSERTRSWVLVRAMKLYLAGEGRDILAALEGRKQIAEGRVHDMDAVLEELRGLAGEKAA